MEHLPRRIELTLPIPYSRNPTMTRKHFAALAAAIRQIEDYNERRRAAELIARACRQFNSGFSYERFYAACGCA